MTISHIAIAQRPASNGEPNVEGERHGATFTSFETHQGCSISCLILVEGKIKNVQTDNGSEFHFDAACESMDLPQYWSRPRNPKDNAVNERFNRTIQDEFLAFGNMTADTVAFNRRLTEWLVEYNFRRPHQALNYMPPVSFTFKYHKVLPMYRSSPLLLPKSPAPLYYCSDEVLLSSNGSLDAPDEFSRTPLFIDFPRECRSPETLLCEFQKSHCNGQYEIPGSVREALFIDVAQLCPILVQVLMGSSEMGFSAPASCRLPCST